MNDDSDFIGSGLVSSSPLYKDRKHEDDDLEIVKITFEDKNDATEYPDNAFKPI